MLSNGTAHLNGHGLNGNGVNGYGHMLECPSDHPVIDIVPTTPKTSRPRWRDELAPYTHTLQRLDGDGHSHSMTLRSDSLQDLLSDLKLLKSMVKQAKQKHADANPEQRETQLERVVCKIHGAEMERRVSRRTGGHYFSHKLADRELCFGRPKA